tara:strand:- start:116758 stop:117129 length:372 start_codon:yes stop_codon:yes gene_type:complete
MIEYITKVRDGIIAGLAAVVLAACASSPKITLGAAVLENNNPDIYEVRSCLRAPDRLVGKLTTYDNALCGLANYLAHLTKKGEEIPKIQEFRMVDSWYGNGIFCGLYEAEKKDGDRPLRRKEK